MDVIPVLDLKGGRAVHARRGERATYAPVSSALGTGDDVLALAAAFRDRLGCRTLYVADLDAIGAALMSAPDQPVAANRLLPDLAALGLALWVDAGVRTPAHADAVLDSGATRVVIGLETLPDRDALAGIMAHVGAGRTVFSLDLRAGVPMAADAELSALAPLAIAGAAVATGIDTLIVLDLARVGTSAGPPWLLLREVRAALPDTRLVAGGGVRDVADLERLADLGCAAALVATALHEGRVGRAALEKLRTIAPG